MRKRFGIFGVPNRFLVPCLIYSKSQSDGTKSLQRIVRPCVLHRGCTVEWCHAQPGIARAEFQGSRHRPFSQFLLGQR